MGATHEIVTVDVGGTHARFAIATIGDNGTITLGEPTTLHTETHASFQTAWEDYRDRMGGSLPDDVAMAVAGQIKPDIIRFTNNPWIIRPPLIREKLGCSRHLIVNDFEAVAHAAARAPSDEFLHLTGPETDLPATGTISVLGPGTGLGVAHFWRDGIGNYRVQATEGGHGDFAPSTRSRTRSSPACASATIAFRPSGSCPARRLSTFTKRSPRSKAALSSNWTMWRSGPPVSAAKTALPLLRLTVSAFRLAR